MKDSGLIVIYAHGLQQEDKAGSTQVKDEADGGEFSFRGQADMSHVSAQGGEAIQMVRSKASLGLGGRHILPM